MINYANANSGMVFCLIVYETGRREIETERRHASTRPTTIRKRQPSAIHFRY